MRGDVDEASWFFERVVACIAAISAPCRCPNCGVVAKAEFPDVTRREMRRDSWRMAALAVVCLVLSLLIVLFFIDLGHPRW